MSDPTPTASTVQKVPEQITVAELPLLVGLPLAPSDWVLVDQARIDAFARCTDDQQFIHIDPERARTESPFGTTVAHGFLTLSLLAAHQPADFPRVVDAAVVVNYGLERLRFVEPVPAGARVRLLTRVLEAVPKGAGRTLLKQETTMQIEGNEKPAYVVEQLTLFIAKRGTL